MPLQSDGGLGVCVKTAGRGVMDKNVGDCLDGVVDG